MNTTNNPNIGLDIDGVLAGFRIAWSKKYPEIDAKSSSWHFDDKIKERFDTMIKDNMLDEFYLNIPTLIKPEDIPFELTCYITARPVNSDVTEKWLNLHGFPTKPVVTVGINKTKIDAAKENHVEIFIDDNYDNFVELNDNGIFCYLYTAPWNIKYDVGHMRLNSLKDILLSS